MADNQDRRDYEEAQASRDEQSNRAADYSTTSVPAHMERR